ncbi:MAG: VWA domain-containing protein [Puniceicoccaceae bacterium]|nr:MAG: VWA domain-containing protein [Puniceicoccaceae bacterium]
MNFAQPIWLYLTPLILLIFGSLVAYGLSQRSTLLSRFASSRLLDQLTAQASLSRTWIKAGCILLAVLGTGLALARPQWGIEWSERKTRGLDIVFVLDSSRSMLATDLRPTRLDRAKLAISDLVDRLESDRIGLVPFAGQAFLQTPLTLDYATFRESLHAIDPGIMTLGGTDIGHALKEAAVAFPANNNVKVIVLLTDGEDLGESAIQAAQEVGATGIKVFAIGVGTPEGSYLRIRNEQGMEEFVRDADGQPVRSQLDEATLQTIAQSTGGNYSRLSNESLEQFYRSVIATLPREERQAELQEVRVERFQWALSAALFFLVAEIFIRRRRQSTVSTSALLFALFCLHPSESHAQDDTPALDARSTFNAAYEALISGDYLSALQEYESALTQTNDLQLQRDALYNMGHAAHQLGRASYQAGDLQAALEQMEQANELFQSAREIDPTDTIIADDLEQVNQVREANKELLEQQEEQQEQDQSPSDQSPDPEDTPDSDESNDSQSSDESDDSKQDPSSSDQPDEPDSGSDESTDSSDNQEAGQEEPGNQTDDDSESGQQQESTHDPLDDLPQPQEDASDKTPETGQEEAPEQGEDGTPETGEDDTLDPGEEEAPADMPEAGQEETDAETSADGDIRGEVIEGMSEAEAKALLDSLRTQEKLLPFHQPSRPVRPRDTRDW